MKRQIAAIVILALVGGLTLFLVTRNQVVATIPAQAELIVIPPFKSGVEGVAIVSADVVYDPVAAPSLQLEIQNNTARSVVGVHVNSGTSGQGRSGDSGRPFLQPFGSATMMFPVSNLTPAKPLSISAVV
nr:hypothetical protein [Pyrinomonadaceae bacterium]